MPEPPPDPGVPPRPDRFRSEVEKKEQRKLKARREGERDAVFWVGMFGLVGWSVALPTVLFTALGVYIDSKVDQPYSWTLMLLFAGLVLGCLNAWYWIKREIRDDDDRRD